MIKPQIINAIPKVESFLRHCQRHVHKAKSVILREGELSESLFLILEGSVSVLVEDENDKDHKMVVAYLNAGDFLGEMSLFKDEDEMRSAQIIARSQCEVA